jgi:hypothetical protein
MTGVAIIAGLSVAVALSAVTLGPVRSPDHHATAVPTTTAGDKRRAEFGAQGSVGAGPAPYGVSTDRRAASASPALTGAVILDPPSGATSTLHPGGEATVVLAAPAGGRWGTAVVAKGGASVLTVVQQATDAAGGTRFTVKALRDGVARVTVPSRGGRTGPWHGTFKVLGAGSGGTR